MYDVLCHHPARNKARVDSGASGGRTRVDSGASGGRDRVDSGGDKRKVKFMEGKGGAGKGEEVVQPLGNGGDADPTESIKRNFFDFQDDADTDVWGPKFTRTLRKAR